jgi:hypothetical protein
LETWEEMEFAAPKKRLDEKMDEIDEIDEIDENQNGYWRSSDLLDNLA